MRKKVKIIGIMGSPRLNGGTATLCREALKGAKEQGAEVSEIILCKYKIEFCKGCLSCLAKGGCVISDDMALLKKELAQADGFILASPNYANSYNAKYKQFVERLGMFEFMTSTIFGAKHVAGLAVAGGSGAKTVAKMLVGMPQNTIFRKAYVSGILGIDLKGKEAAELPEAMEAARELGKKITLDAQGEKKYPLQNLLSRAIINLFVKPNFKKFIIRDKNGKLKAVYENLALRKLI